MRGFIRKVLLYLTLTLACFIVVRTYTINYRAKNYFSAFVDKLKILLKNRSQRKILLIGGSSVGFGISAELIEQQTGIKTINLGLHKGFGLVDFQQFIMKNMTRDDIVIFSPEWIFYENPEYVDPGTLEGLNNNNLDYGMMIGKPERVLGSFFSPVSFSEFSRSGMEEQIGKQKLPYIYNCINTNGDIISHCHLKPPGPTQYKINISKFDVKKFIKTYRFINQYKTIVVFPPTQKIVYNSNKTNLRNIENQLSENKIIALDAVEDYVYPDSSFFDAEYHLTCEARQYRTLKIIAFLKSNRKIFSLPADSLKRISNK